MTESTASEVVAVVRRCTSSGLVVNRKECGSGPSASEMAGSTRARFCAAGADAEAAGEAVPRDGGGVEELDAFGGFCASGAAVCSPGLVRRRSRGRSESPGPVLSTGAGGGGGAGCGGGAWAAGGDDVCGGLDGGGAELPPPLSVPPRFSTGGASSSSMPRGRLLVSLLIRCSAGRAATWFWFSGCHDPKPTHVPCTSCALFRV